MKRRQSSAPSYDYRAMVDDAEHGILVHRHFKPLYANTACARLFGFKDAEEFLALPLLRPLIPPENWPIHEANHAALLLGRSTPGLVRLRMRSRDGSEIWLAATRKRVMWPVPKGRPQPAAEWQLFDITDQMHGEQRVQDSEQRLRTVLEVLPHPVLIARQGDGRILFVNRKSCLLLAQSAGALLKSTMAAVFVEEQDLTHFLTLLGAVREVREQEMTLRAHDGRHFAAEIAAMTIDYSGQPAILLAINDVSARKRLEAELFHQASTDPLTGIANRRAFMTRGEQELRRARRFGRALTVMMLDIDHFKAVNDTYGHAGGDITLQKIVGFCTDRLRGTDTLGRLGGEEFAVLMPETALDAATEVADRLRQHIADQVIPFGTEQIRCTVSIGLATLQPPDTDIDALLQRADQALYLAKHNGRNRVVGAT